MFKSIGFIGLGLIGGSIARAVREKHPQIKLAAYDIDKKSLSLALSDGVIDTACESFEPEKFCENELIILCTPVLSSGQYLEALSACIGDTILSDVGSVKGEIFSLVERYRLSDNFIGGHPMAGTEKSGYENSFASLLERATYVLTPSQSVAYEKVRRMERLIESLGSRVLTLAPERHDLAAAAISHVPHILAYSLINLIRLSDDEDDAMHLMAAGGLRDMTRIASSSPNMWKQICLANRENISLLLSEYIKELSDIKTELDEGDGETIFSRFEAAKKYRDTF